nr:hypothetical protein [uncultured Blautia sp.]
MISVLQYTIKNTLAALPGPVIDMPGEGRQNIRNTLLHNHGERNEKTVLLLALLVISICGCGGKKIDLDEYEQLNEIYYARVDLEEEVILPFTY